MQINMQKSAPKSTFFTFEGLMLFEHCVLCWMSFDAARLNHFKPFQTISNHFKLFQTISTYRTSAPSAL